MSKKESIPKNRILTSVVIGTLVVIIMILLAENYHLNSNMTDAERFYMEYSTVPVNNAFKIVSANEAYELLESEQAIVFFGFKECKWCRSYVPLLNDVISENDVPVVYYCNIKRDRAQNTEIYIKLVEKLSEYLYEDDNKNKRIYVPDIYFVKDGKILGHNNDTSLIEGGDVEGYYTEDVKVALKQKLKDLVLQVYPNECTDDKRGC